MRRPIYHKLLRPSPTVEKYLGGLEAAVMAVLWTSCLGTGLERQRKRDRSRGPACADFETIRERATGSRSLFLALV
jgi:hypothetical protein